MLSQNTMGCGSEETTVSPAKSPLTRTHPHTAGQTPGDEQERQSEGSAAAPAAAVWGRKVQRCLTAVSPAEREGPFPRATFLYILLNFSCIYTLYVFVFFHI